LMMVENNHFEAEMLKEIKNKSTQDKQLSSKVFFDLSKLLRLFDYRLNPFAWLVLNGLFLWDLNKSIEIKNWLRTYSWQIDEKIDLIAKIEAIISVATFAYNHPNYILPKLDSKHIIQAKNLAHPLIRTRGRVGNDFEIADNGKICLLTGANMAGKSTFMRTVGINLVLAWTGAPVCAEAFSFKPIWIYSGMRSVDSLSESTSSFFAELKRLSNLVKEAQNGKRVFALLDEILKGTNSKDRNLGSKGLIEKLIKLQTSAIITTHDLELADIKTAFPENVDLKCFEIETRNDELVFDFKLRDGVCRHQNATFLMKKMAII